jgi:hypothetical protein
LLLAAFSLGISLLELGHKSHPNSIRFCDSINLSVMNPLKPNMPTDHKFP